MLVVSRGKDEKIHIDGGITIMVIRISRDTVRLGIQAPAGCKIVREELLGRPPVTHKLKEDE